MWWHLPSRVSTKLLIQSIRQIRQSGYFQVFTRRNFLPIIHPERSHMKQKISKPMGSAIATALFTSLMLALVGCSSEPSASDIEQTIRAASPKSTEVHAVRKVGCAQAQGAAGYMCDVELDATEQRFNPFGKSIPVRNKAILKLRFFQDEGKWKVSKD